MISKSITKYPTISSFSSTFTRSFSANIDPTKTIVLRTKNPKQKTKKDELIFGRTFTDHMLQIDWTEKNGWEPPVISEYGNLSLSPAASALHYGIECFEGMKAYKDSNGNIRLFRPDCNMARLRHSMLRLAMPEIDGDKFTECIKQLLREDASWVPEGEGYSMYIRPTGKKKNEKA